MNMGPGEDSHFMGASKACDGAFGGISLSWQQQPWEWAWVPGSGVWKGRLCTRRRGRAEGVTLGNGLM